MAEEDERIKKTMGKLLKKGQSFEDTVYMVVMIVALGIGALVATYSYSAFVDMTENTSAFNSSTSVMDSFRAGETVNSYWDYLILVVLIGFAISVVILGYFVETHPVFMVLYVIGMIVGVLFSVIMTHVWDSVIVDTTFGTLASTNLPITDHIISNMAIYFTIIAMLGFIALYAKTRQLNE